MEFLESQKLIFSDFLELTGLKRLEKGFEAMSKNSKNSKNSRNVKNSSLEDIGASCEQKLVCSDNPRQNIWNRVKQSSKIRYEFALFFCVLFDHYYKIFICVREIGH